MSKSPATPARLKPVRLGPASRLTLAEVNGPYAEIGMLRSKTPI
jgi:hypothetical protein